ncbi:hypothetical protein CEXT_446081 [Caerostris extrusa]|uniref:Uncharacterized protein n=1 Tax=Caerostris extrusa TaxID=172846 RepID=A0AAV4RC83_CAEEX|nr:hypothetical protein CEXT_446081 [Caerostris extrusa]
MEFYGKFCSVFVIQSVLWQIGSATLNGHKGKYCEESLGYHCKPPSQNSPLMEWSPFFGRDLEINEWESFRLLLKELRIDTGTGPLCSPSALESSKRFSPIPLQGGVNILTLKEREEVMLPVDLTLDKTIGKKIPVFRKRH